MRRVLVMLTAALAALLFGFVAASPARAVDSNVGYEQGGRCVAESSSTSDAIALMTSCGSLISKWSLTSAGTLNGHPLVQIRNRSNGRCLDSHDATNGGAAWVISCYQTTNKWQVWEVFDQTNGSQVFKSYGHYTYRGTNMCLSRNASVDNNSVKVRTCDAASGTQRFNRQDY